MAGHEDAGIGTGPIGTSTPKFVPPRRGRPRLDPTQTGLWKFGHGFGARWNYFHVSNSLMGSFGKGSLQKHFRNFRNISANFPQNFRTLSDAIKRIFRELSAEFPQTFRENPFANDPISELLTMLFLCQQKNLDDFFSMVTPGEPRREKSIVHLLGGEPLLEKCRREIFKRRERGLTFFGHVSDRFWSFCSRLSFPGTGPPGPWKGFGRVSEGVSEGVFEGVFWTPSETLPTETLPKPFQGPGGPVAGNESLDLLPFSNHFSYRFKSSSGAISSCRCAALRLFFRRITRDMNIFEWQFVLISETAQCPWRRQ